MDFKLVTLPSGMSIPEQTLRRWSEGFFGAVDAETMAELPAEDQRYIRSEWIAFPEDHQPF